MKALAAGKRRRLVPAPLELVGEPVEQPGAGAATEVDHGRRLAASADAVKREQQLLVGAVEAVVLALGGGVHLDRGDSEERFGLSIGVLDDRPRTTTLRSLRLQQVDDVRNQ